MRSLASSTTARTAAPSCVTATWEGDPAPLTTGAINHWAFDTPDIEAAFENAKELGLKFKDTEIQHIDSFWEHGIRFFNVYGPNGETIEFCQIV